MANSKPDAATDVPTLTTANHHHGRRGGGSRGRRLHQQQREEVTMTKRQRRKRKNDKNLWVPHHPKIQSAEKRAAAYLRNSGLMMSKNSKQQQRQKEEELDPAVDLNSPEVKFGRLLGSADQRVRHAAVLQLQAYLKARCDISSFSSSSSSPSSNSKEKENNNDDDDGVRRRDGAADAAAAVAGGGGLSELDLLKLWKGLWFTLYMADKVPVQDELSAKIASLIWCVAGTEEEDEYVAQAYVYTRSSAEAEEEMANMLEEEAAEANDDDSDRGNDNGSNNMEGGDDDDSEVIMAEVANTLNDNGDYDDYDDNSSDGEDNPHVVVDDEDDDCDDDSYLEDSQLVRHCRGAHLAALLVRTFFRTVRRQWGCMDKYRVDKFYTLVRYVVAEIYRYCASRHWNLGIIRIFNDAVYEEVLSRTPNGLRFHLIDITVEELAKVNASAPMPLTEATFLDCLEPYFAMAQSGGADDSNNGAGTGGAGDDAVQRRVVDNILAKFLEEYSVVSDNYANRGSKDSDNNDVDDDDSSDGAGGADKDISSSSLVFDQVHVGTVGKFIFELGSDGRTTKDQYRKSLYDQHKLYTKRIKEVGADVELHVHEEEEDVEDEEGGGEVLMEKLEIEKDDSDATSKHGEKPIKNEDGKNEIHNSDENSEPPEEPSKTKKERKKKKKKEKKKKRKLSEDDPEPKEGQDEEVIISAADQKAAKKALQSSAAESGLNERETCKKKKKEAKMCTSDGTSSTRRVIFNEFNHARSYKASMKGLRRMESPTALTSKPPDKTILKKSLAYTKSRTVGKKKAQNNLKRRKKAHEYF